MNSELDKTPYYGFSEPDYSHPFSVDMEDSEPGQFVSECIKRYLKPDNLKLSENAQYLALAAGAAIPELFLAKDLGITDNNVTLLDRRFLSKTRHRLTLEHPTISIVNMGMFEFLLTNPKPTYDLITVFGAEYALESKTAIKSIINGTSANLNKGGILTIFPYSLSHFDPSYLFEQNDMSLIAPHLNYKSGMLLYVQN